MTEFLANFDAEQSLTLSAVLSRLIPEDDLGPGALEAGVLTFIDRQLSSSQAHLRRAYAGGIDGLDEFARRRTGRTFAELPPQAQDDVLRGLETAAEDGPPAELRAWFELVLADCVDGFLSDPMYGGNRDGAGWKLIGYPGPSLVWTEQEQVLDVRIPYRNSSAASFAGAGEED